MDTNKTLDDLRWYLKAMHGNAHGNFLAQIYDDPDDLCFWYNEGIQNMCSDAIDIAESCKDIEEFIKRFPREYCYDDSKTENYVDGVKDAIDEMWGYIYGGDEDDCGECIE